MAPSTRRYKSLHGNASKLLQRKTRSLAPGKGSAKKRDDDTAEPKSDENSGDNENNAPGPVVKKAKQGNKGTRIQAPGSPNQSKSASDVNTNKAQDIMSKYRTLPLFDMNLLKPTKATSETVLAFVLEAMLISACISHKLAYKSVKCLFEVGYYDARTQKKSSWEKRTEVLTKGGYTSYHEKTATTLGRLAEFVLNEYGMSLYAYYCGL
jgi:hypothetical protein